jgi:hypothetical protein
MLLCYAVLFLATPTLAVKHWPDCATSVGPGHGKASSNTNVTLVSKCSGAVAYAGYADQDGNCDEECKSDTCVCIDLTGPSKNCTYYTAL